MDGIYTLPKNDSALLTRDFRAFEFDCPCRNCQSTLVSEELLLKLQVIRDILKSPIKINSGYRCEEHQKELEALGYETAPYSQHLRGCAADIQSIPYPGVYLERVAKQAGFRAIGVGQSWIHVDTRKDKDRQWEYKKR